MAKKKPEPAVTYDLNFDLRKVKGNPANPRTITDAAKADLAASLDRFGMVEVLVINRRPRGELVMVSGHQRRDALVAAGKTRAPVALVRLAEKDERALALKLNGHSGAWDFAKLDPILRLLAADGEQIDLASLGISQGDINKALADLNDEDDGDDEVPEVQAKAHSKPGEIYALGPHLLICGDSTKADHWQSLLGSEMGDAVMTDPPYGVNYVGKTKDALPVENDDPEGLPALLDGALGNALARTKLGGAFFVAAPAGPLHLHFANWLNKHDILRACLIWVKDSMVLGHGDYHYQHEPIYYGWKPGAPHRQPPDRTQVSVWNFPRPKRSTEHPTMKPVELYERMMRNHTSIGDIILEPFGGSGTTLIAAEKTGRRCRAFEIAPRYCDVIRRRWTRYAKENSIKPGSGALDG